MLPPESRIPVTREELRKRDEAQTVEWKKSLNRQKEAGESLCALLNTDVGSGAVIFGVTPEAVPVGVEEGNLDTAQRSLVEHIHGRLDPKTPLSVQLWDCEGKTLVALEATRSRTVPYHQYDGRAWIKEGTSKRVLTVAEQQQLVRRRNRDLHNGPWQCDRCGAWSREHGGVVITAAGPQPDYMCPRCGKGEYWPA